MGKAGLVRKFEGGLGLRGGVPAPSLAMNMRVEPELVGNAEDYKPFSREFLAEHSSAVLKATMDIISCHTADAFCAILCILCEKYGLGLDDIVETIKGHDRWKTLQTHPLIKSLTYFDEDDVPDLRAGRDMSGNVWAGMPLQAVATLPPKRRKVAAKHVDTKTADEIAKLSNSLATTSISKPATEVLKPVKLKLKKAVVPTEGGPSCA